VSSGWLNLESGKEKGPDWKEEFSARNAAKGKIEFLVESTRREERGEIYFENTRTLEKENGSGGIANLALA